MVNTTFSPDVMLAKYCPAPSQKKSSAQFLFRVVALGCGFSKQWKALTLVGVVESTKSVNVRFGFEKELLTVSENVKLPLPRLSKPTLGKGFGLTWRSRGKMVCSCSKSWLRYRMAATATPNRRAKTLPSAAIFHDSLFFCGEVVAEPPPPLIEASDYNRFVVSHNAKRVAAKAY